MKKSVLIFGATGGIGQVLVNHFISSGTLVTAASRSAGTVGGNRVFPITADVTESGQIKQAFEQHQKHWGVAPEVVVNAAALQGPIGSYWEVDDREWEQTINIDLIGSYKVMAEATRRMKGQGAGSIILFSGGGAVYGRPNFSAYAAAKAGVLRLVENAADELQAAGLTGIRVFAVAPGAVRSRMTSEVLAAGMRAGGKAQAEAMDTMQTGGTEATQITRLIEFLTGETSGGLSGRLIHVREDYQEYGDKAIDAIPAEVGKLRRIPL